MPSGEAFDIAGKYLSAYGNEMAWREDNRRVSHGLQFLMATNAALAHPVSRVWKGYWQRSAISTSRFETNGPIG